MANEGISKAIRISGINAAAHGRRDKAIDRRARGPLCGLLEREITHLARKNAALT
jgi:hypothetical protein